MDRSMKIFFKNQETEIAIINEEQIIIRFSKAGKYDIRHIVSDEYSSTTYTGNVTVTDNITTQEISLITIDETTGKHLISWEEPQILPAGAESINIYKETSRYEEYELIANVPIGTKKLYRQELYSRSISFALPSILGSKLR